MRERSAACCFWKKKKKERVGREERESVADEEKRRRASAARGRGVAAKTRASLAREEGEMEEKLTAMSLRVSCLFFSRATRAKAAEATYLILSVKISFLASDCS